MKHLLLFAALFGGALAAVNTMSSNNNNMINALLSKDDSMIAASNYQQGERPNRNGGPTTVQVNMHVQFVEWKQQKLTMQVYFRQFWHDPRLIHSGVGGSNRVTVSGDQANRIWTPDSFFIESTSVEHNPRESFIRVTPNGYVSWSRRMKLVIPCATYTGMIMSATPHKTNCSLTIESYAYSASQIKFEWKDGITGARSVTLGDDMMLRSILSKVTPEDMTVHLNTGNYSRLRLKMLVQTQPDYQLEACVRKCLMQDDKC